MKIETDEEIRNKATLFVLNLEKTGDYTANELEYSRRAFFHGYRCKAYDNTFIQSSPVSGSDEEKAIGWIDVKERLPDVASNDGYRKSVKVLVFSENEILEAVNEQGVSPDNLFNHWYSSLLDDTIDNVTHWMPRPENPLYIKETTKP